MRFRRNTGFLVLSLLTAFFLSACGGGGGGDAPPPPPTTTTVAATGISLHTATLNGTVNPHSQATNAWFEWGTDSALTAPTLTTAQAIGAGSADNSVSATITGLALGTTYYYRVAAQNGSGTEKGTIASFTTALPNSPPSVTTNAATGVTISGATLNGTVSPNELATTAVFEWGTDSNLATFSTTSSQSLGSGTTSVAITATLSSLTPGVTYYFRVAATNSAGTSKGSIVSFNTVAQPPTVVTSAATSITTSGGTLNGSVNPNGLATTAVFEWGTDSNLATFSTTASQSLGSGTTSVAITATLSSLTPATTYYFRVAATNSAGTSKGSIVSFNTVAQPPTVVTTAADNISITGATLHGTVNPNGLAVTDAHFEYGTDSSLTTFSTTGVQTLAAGFSAQAITASPSGLIPATTYYFRVAATNSAGTSKGLILAFDTLVNPPPVASAGPDNTVVMGHPVTLDGSGSSDDGHGGTITYAWTQLSGTSVVLSGATTAAPTFTAPTVSYPNDNLVFRLTVTSSRGPTATDNVKITVNWGFSDDFSVDSTGGYTTVLTGSGAAFAWDSIGKRAQVTTGNDNGVVFSKTIPASNQGVFSLDFNPTSPFYGSHGGLWIRLMQDANNFYEVSNFDWGAGTPTAPDVAAVRKFVGGSVTPVDELLFTTGYSQDATYNIKITFSPTQVKLEGFGAPVILNTTDTTAVSVNSFNVETGQQDAYYDNILLEAGP